MKVKFSRCISSNLANVPQVDGQLIYVKDTSEVYMDVGNSRNKLSDVIEVADITNIQNPIISKIYYDEATENLYKYIDNEWKSLGGSSSPQVFYWDGTNSSDAIALWNQIYQISREKDVIVISRKQDNDPTTPIIYPIKKQMDLTQNIRGIANLRKNIGVSHTDLYLPYYTVRCIINDEQVTTIMINKSEEQTPLLESSFNYSQPYVPQYPGSPATKKYVDDQVGSINTLLDSINGEVV